MKKIVKFLLLLILVTSLSVANPILGAFSPSKTDNNNQGSAVVFQNEPIFYIKESLGPLSPEARAQNTSQKLEDLAKNFSIAIDLIKAEEYENIIFISAENISLINVSPKDAEAERVSQEELAKKYINLFKKIIKKYRNQYSIHQLILAVIYTVITTLITGL